MAWIDIVIGFLFGFISSIILKHRFSQRPTLTILTIILFVIIAIGFSDLLVTPKDRPWNPINSIVIFFLGQTPQ